MQYVPAYRALMQAGSEHIVDDISTLLRIWDLTTFYPLVFHVAVQDLERDAKLGILDLLKAYIIRRELCGLTPKNYNNVVLRCLQRLRTSGTSAESLVVLFQEMPGDATRMPTDEEVIQHCSQRAVYGEMPTPRLRFVLGALEQSLRTSFDENVPSTSALTVEHILPQQWAEKWPMPDGRFAPTESSINALVSYKVDSEMQEQLETRERLLHSLGNLTLVTSSLNPSLGNESFDEKKVQLARSLLVLNREVASLDKWDEAAIQQRGIYLATKATQVWPATATGARV